MGEGGIVCFRELFGEVFIGFILVIIEVLGDWEGIWGLWLL